VCITHLGCMKQLQSSAADSFSNRQSQINLHPPALPVVAEFYYSRPIFQLYGYFIFILQMMRWIDYHETDYVAVFLHCTDMHFY